MAADTEVSLPRWSHTELLLFYHAVWPSSLLRLALHLWISSLLDLRPEPSCDAPMQHQHPGHDQGFSWWQRHHRCPEKLRIQLLPGGRRRARWLHSVLTTLWRVRLLYSVFTENFIISSTLIIIIHSQVSLIHELITIISYASYLERPLIFFRHLYLRGPYLLSEPSI